MREIRYLKMVKTMIVCFCLILLLTPVSANATGLTDETELILHYEGGYTTFYFYKVADFEAPDHYTVTEKFRSYVGEVTGLDRIKDLTTEEIKMLASTLRSLTITSAIDADEAMDTDLDGTLVWKNVPKGLYLIVGDKTYDEEYVYTPMPVILSVPYETVNGEWQDSVEVLHNKLEKKELERAARMTVFMVWRNRPAQEEEVPEESEVTLFQNSETYDTEEFSEENDWSYTWEDLEPVEEWNVEEEKLPDGFTYSYVPDEEGIVIINTYEEEVEQEYDEKLPQTGQTWWPVPVLAVWGCSFYLAGWILNKKKIV